MQYRNDFLIFLLSPRALEKNNVNAGAIIAQSENTDTQKIRKISRTLTAAS